MLQQRRGRRRGARGAGAAPAPARARLGGATTPPAHDKLRALLDAAPGIHLLIDGEGVVREAYGADLGLLHDSPAGRPLAALVLRASHSTVADVLARGGADEPVELQLRGRRGRRLPGSATARPIPGGLAWTVVVEAPPELRQVFERLNQGVVVVDRTLRVRLANSAARRIVGPRLRARARLAEGDSFALHETASRLLAAEDVADVVLSPDGVSSYVLTGIPATRKDDDVVLVVTDVSERERAERVEREFVANASHELRTPLATITGAIEILQAGAKEDEEARDRFLRHIEREVVRLGRLVNALLTLARVQAAHELPDLTDVAVRPLLDEVAGRLAPAPSVDVLVSCPAALAVVAHPDLLLEIVSNLAANAVKHTREGRIDLRALASGDAASIEVRDTGDGIAEDEQEQLFLRFYRGSSRRKEGFGLGLAIVRDAVTALGGSVEVESTSGVGTTVRVTLPRARKKKGAAA